MDGRAHPGKKVVYDKAKAPFNPSRMRPRVSDKVLTVNVWAAITDKGFLAYHIYEGTLNADGYMDILQAKLLPAARKHFGSKGQWRFQQDNAPIHTAKKVKAMFKKPKWKNVTVIDWPPYRPDLNLIENAWVQLQRKVAMRSPKGKENVKKAIVEAIAQMNKEEPKTNYFHNLFASFPKRCQEVVDNNGFPTRH
jgi:transposase